MTHVDTEARIEKCIEARLESEARLRSEMDTLDEMYRKVTALVAASNALCVATKNALKLLQRGQANDAHAALVMGMQSYNQITPALRR